MRYRLLGPVQLVDGGSLVRVEGVKARALLTALLVNANRVVSAESLAGHIWGDEPPPSAVGTLQAYVSRLRRLLGDGKLVTCAPGYQIVVGPDDLDVTRFERLLALGRDASRLGRPRRAATLLRQALDLWRGPCLGEFRRAPFAVAEVARLERLRAAAVEELIGARLAMGEHEEVTAELDRLTAQHPAREALWCHLMVALYRGGRRVDALDVYNEATRRLSSAGRQHGERAAKRPRREEVSGPEPGLALRELRRRILTHDPELLWRPANPLPVAIAGAATASPMVGRAAELDRLLDAWRRTGAGDPRMVAVTGEPGIGKTRLVTELALAVRRQGAHVLWGRSAHGDLAPYQPIAEALCDYTDRLSPEELADQLGPHAPYLTPLLPDAESPRGPDRDAKTRRHRMFEAVAGLLRAATAEAPALLVLDDLHRADRSTLLLLEHLVRHPRRPRCLIVTTYRETDTLAGLTAGLCAEGLADRLALAELDGAEIDRLIREVAGQPVPAAVTRAVHAQTGGNPLFVTEAVHGVRETGHQEGDATMRALVEQRLARLPCTTREALGAAATLGPEFTLDLLPSMLTQTEQALTEHLKPAIDAEVLRADAAGYAFSHPLIHEIVYDGLPRPRRAALHRRAGEILAAAPHAERGRYAEMARHFRQAALDDAVRAMHYCLRAGEEARALLGLDEARRYHEEALGLLDVVESMTDPADRPRPRDAGRPAAVTSCERPPPW
jgi:DNA-binding SARP family transcriptional activator